MNCDLFLVSDKPHRDMAVASSSQSNRTPPPEDLPRPISPGPEEREESATSPWSLPHLPQAPSESLRERSNASRLFHTSMETLAICGRDAGTAL